MNFNTCKCFSPDVTKYRVPTLAVSYYFFQYLLLLLLCHKLTFVIAVRSETFPVTELLREEHTYIPLNFLHPVTRCVQSLLLTSRLLYLLPVFVFRVFPSSLTSVSLFVTKSLSLERNHGSAISLDICEKGTSNGQGYAC
jgi:hypothetical protein